MKESCCATRLIENSHEPLRAVLLFGPPGSGKGTLGKFLSLIGNHLHLSSGEIFRGLSPDSAAGRLYESYANKGLLLPDEATIEIWQHYVHGLIATNRYFPNKQLLLLDGIPRTQQQARMLEKYVNILKIIVLEVTDPQVLIERLRKRATIEKRMDDFDKQVLTTRMEVYHNETLKLLAHYDAKNQIARFDAAQKPIEVLRDVLVDLAGLFN